MRRRMETVLAALGTCFCGYLAWAMAYFTWRSFDSGQTSVSSGTLVWIPQAFVSFGIILLTVQFVARFFQAALGLPLEDLNMRAGEVAE
jgi:TRAP-type C4-dicarboxylate transport system permease small subunit